MSAQLNDVSMNKKGLLFLFTVYSCIGKRACLIKIYLIVYSYAFGRHIAFNYAFFSSCIRWESNP